MFSLSTIHRSRRVAPVGQHASQMFVTSLFAATLLIGIGPALIPSPAAAKRVPPGGDTVQLGCKSLQDQSYDLLAEYKRLGEGKWEISERMREIIVEFRNLNSTWKQIGCQKAWGDIVGLIVVGPSVPWGDEGVAVGGYQKAIATDGTQDVIVGGDDVAVAPQGNQEIHMPENDQDAVVTDGPQDIVSESDAEAVAPNDQEAVVTDGSPAIIASGDQEVVAGNDQQPMAP